MLKVIMRRADFNERFEELRRTQVVNDPCLATAIAFLGVKIEDVSGEAVLASILKNPKIELRD